MEINKFPYNKCKFYVPYSVIGVDNSSIKTQLLEKIPEEKVTEQLLPKINNQREESLPTNNAIEKIYITELSIKNNLASNGKKLTSLKRDSFPRFLRNPSNAKQNYLDYFLELIGSFGFYQVLQFFLVGVMAILPSMVAYSYVFVSATPKFTCKTALEVGQFNVASFGDIQNHDYFDFDLNLKSPKFLIEKRRLIQLISNANITQKQVKFDNKCSFSDNEIKQIRQTNQLLMEKKLNLTFLRSSLECIEYLYDESMYGRTLVSELNLVCSKSHLKAATQNAFILGTGCSVFTGILSDKYGRRKALILMITLMFLVLNITQISMHSAVLSINQKLVLFIISRFWQGVAQTMYSIFFVLLLEITGPKHRVTAGNILAYSFSVGQMVIVFLAYFFKDWRKVQWTLAIYVMPFFLYYWLVPESPRWLLATNRVREAIKVLKKITNVNSACQRFLIRIQQLCKRSKSQLKENNRGIDFNSEVSAAHIFSLLQQEAYKIKSQRKTLNYIETLKDIIQSPILIKRCIIIFYNWMVILAVYLGIGMGISGNLDEYINPYLVFFIAALCEFLSIVTCHLVLDKYGRKKCFVFFMMTCSLTIYLIPIYFHSYPKLSIFFYFLAKYAIGASQLIFMIYTSELYPTPMRSTGVGLSVSIARLGGVWSPQINVLSSTLGSIHIPFVIFSVAALLASFLCIFLPETLDKPLPENLNQAKNLIK